MECYKKHFFDMDKEEQWLNEMAEKGLVLTKISGGIFRQKYYFEKSDTAYTYRVDYSRDGAVMEEITAPYVMFVTSSCDAEYVCWSDGKVYFRRAKEKGDFAKLYSDPKSRYDAERRRFGSYVGLISLFLMNSVFCGYSVAESILQGSIKVSDIFFTLSVVLCIFCLCYLIYNSVNCHKKMKELKKMMEE